MRAVLVLVPLLGLGLMAAGYRVPDAKLRESDFRPVLLRPVVARTLSRPVLPMLVDVLWLRTLNAIGQRDSSDKNRGLYEYGVALTDIDPRFYEVYKFVGLNVPFASARNTWVNAWESSEMFRRGLRTEYYKQDLKLHVYLGFNLFHRERKFIEASDVFVAASRLPDALDYFAPLAVRLRAHGGSPEEGIAITRRLLEDERDEEVRAMLEARLGDLAVEVVLQRVDRAASAFRERQGREATTLDELRATGLYEGGDLDPLDGRITLKDGKATSTSITRRLEIYE